MRYLGAGMRRSGADTRPHRDRMCPNGADTCELVTEMWSVAARMCRAVTEA